MRPKIAFITGASRGIGYAIAEEFAKAGYLLAINSRDEAGIREAAEKIETTNHSLCMSIAGDISEETFVKEAFDRIKKRFGPVDVLVNNAGISKIGLLTELTLSDWNRIMNTNLTSAFLCSRQAIGHMLPGKTGKIINISSVWGIAGASCEAAYSASKGGLNALTKALAKELAPSNIQVNAIACGAIDTSMNAGFTEAEKTEIEEDIPAGRFGTPEEVAGLVLSLAKAPAYLTGQVISMDGGWI